tara:strand:- start:316 stop:930 length:615 start_codon:yes stop_codon:yes gene_type:complete
MFYIYQHIRLDTNQIFYIGISHYNKYFKYKRAAQKDKRNSIWKNIVSKTNFIYEIILESENINIIKSKEIELIAYYGKIKYKTGCLANITDGGEGTFGYIHTKENRLKHSQNMKGRKHSEETKLKMKTAQLGKIVSVEVGKKISKSKKGKITGKLHENKPLKVLHIPTNMEFKSITKAAQYFSLRRCTLAIDIYSGKEKDFKIV